MKYFILEIQKLDDTQYATLPVQSADTKEQAESIFYGILQYAAISTIPCHSAVIVDESGFPIRHECYRHEQITNNNEGGN